MLRLTSKDLERLSKQARERVGDAADTKPVRKARKPVAGEPPAKAGRLPRVAYEGPVIIVEMEITPRPKERARTFIDETVLCRAFAAAHGRHACRFMALIKPKARGGEREGGLMRTITPEDTKRYEEVVRLLVGRAMAAAGAEAFKCPLDVVVEFCFQGDPQTWPTAQDDGDLDNLKKAIFDGMNKVAYVDDRLLVRNNSIKQCAERAGVSVTLRPATP